MQAIFDEAETTIERISQFLAQLSHMVGNTTRIVKIAGKG
jgi:hypothetical protein